mmetsp:Transcript_953/g.2057  ORF Transcript_953/g.2057 Transcript_953/m.2057 type:complete len:82 (+) Transcript_953:2242-2487(+)
MIECDEKTVDYERAKNASSFILHTTALFFTLIFFSFLLLARAVPGIKTSTKVRNSNQPSNPPKISHEGERRMHRGFSKSFV